MMKKWTGLMLIFLLTLCAAADRFEVKAIQFSSRKTPVPSYENTNSHSKTSAKRRWLCVETLFVPQGVSRGESWYDDVTMEGALVIVRPGKKEASYVVLTGKTRF